MYTTTYGYACGSREAMLQQAARSVVPKTPDQAACQVAGLRRVALNAGRPVPPRQPNRD